jgi:hypothetical protein|nr:MAG TPA: hypothetical protein [Caudoviricetes sp.]
MLSNNLKIATIQLFAFDTILLTLVVVEIVTIITHYLTLDNLVVDLFDILMLPCLIVALSMFSLHYKQLKRMVLEN